VQANPSKYDKILMEAGPDNETFTLEAALYNLKQQEESLPQKPTRGTLTT